MDPYSFDLSWYNIVYYEFNPCMDPYYIDLGWYNIVYYEFTVGGQEVSTLMQLFNLLVVVNILVSVVNEYEILEQFRLFPLDVPFSEPFRLIH